jgi:HAD superfamily hydrolase (TIGR01548 family)
MVMKEPELLVEPVPAVAEMAPYTGAPVDPLIELKLDSNESLTPVPLLDRPEIAARDFQPNRYLRTDALEARLAEGFGIDPGRVVVTAGADDGLERSIRAVCTSGRHAILTTPTFEILERYVLLAGASSLKVPWWTGDFPVDEVCELAPPDTVLVAVVSPNNPTGAVASAAALEEIARRLPKALILLDHAYVEYGAAADDLTNQALELPNVVVFRTFSKAWSAAGLRVGYALGDPRVIRWLRTLGQPYPVAAPSLTMVMQMLDECGTPSGERIEAVQSQRQSLTELFQELQVEHLPSAANFLLARFDDPGWVRRALACIGIGVRPFPGRGDLEPWLRFTIPGEEDDYARLEAGVRTVLAPQALLFDLDGVIADVSRSYRQAMRQTAAAFGVDISAAEICEAKAAGNANNDWELTCRLMAERGVEPSPDEVLERFEQIYQGSGSEPGLYRNERLLIEADRLRSWASERPMAVVTGRPRQDAERFLEEHGVDDCFAAIVTMEDAPSKPDPAPVRLALKRLRASHAWMLGDTPDDLRSARAAGVLPIGCRAPGDAAVTDAALLEAGAAQILDTVDQLEGVLP